MREVDEDFDDGGTPAWRRQQVIYRSKPRGFWASLTTLQIFFLPWVIGFLVFAAAIIIMIPLEILGIMK